MYLGKYGIGVNMALKIYSEFGEDIYDVVRKNPYEIAERVSGIGFKTVDKLALNAGLPEDSEERIFAAVLFEMNHIMSFGHIYLPENELKRNVYDLISPELSFEDFEERLDNVIFKMERDTSIIVKEVETEGAEKSRIVYAKWNYFMELDSARRLLGLKLDYDVKESEVKAAIKNVEKELGLELAKEQGEAVYNAVCSGVSVITGGPGTGKTTIINAIIKYYENRGDKIDLAAPTGRAAKRITESTGYKAQTIHRLLEFSGELD